MNGFTTKALHAPRPKADPFGALRMAVYDNAAFEFESAEAIEATFTGQKPGHTYTRASNPTVEELENKVKLLSGAHGVVATASGMAAITTAIFALVRSGENIVTTDRLFGHTLSFFKKTAKNLGIETRFVDVLDPAAVAKACDAKTRVIFFETISNPQLQVADAAALSAVAREKNAVLMADTTMTPIYLFDAKKHGVDVEVISATKYISGGGTTIGGLILDHGLFDWGKLDALRPHFEKAGQNALIAKLKKEVYRNLGPALSPHNAYLQSLGLETMALRIERSCQNALELAKWLGEQPQVKTVNYPGLESSPFYAAAKKQFRHAGAILTFDLASKEAIYRFMNALKLVRRATNINDNKSLIIAPYHTIYAENSPEERLAFDVRPTMLRLSVGIEDIEDLKADISEALQAL